MWDPAALLNPGKPGETPTMRPQSAGAIPVFSTRNDEAQRPELSFEFTNPSEPIAPNFTGTAGISADTTNHQAVPPRTVPTRPILQSSLGIRIERLHNGQDRATVPQPKRRKTMNENDPTPSMFSASAFPRSNSGFFTHYLQQHQDLAITSPPKSAPPVEAMSLGFMNTGSLDSGTPNPASINGPNHPNSPTPSHSDSVGIPPPVGLDLPDTAVVGSEVNQTETIRPTSDGDPMNVVPNQLDGIAMNMSHPAPPNPEPEQSRPIDFSTPNNPPKPDLKSAETIDLTGGDVQSTRPPPRDPVKDEEVCYGKVEGTSINSHRVPAHKPGTITMNDAFWPIVKVVLRRKAGDKTRDIHVYDYTRKVFGKVDDKTAECLAPLLDSQLQIRTDCRIPSRRKLPGEQIGQAVSLNYKFDLMLYGPRKYAVQVGKYLANHQLNLVSPPRVDPGIKVFNPLARENRPLVQPRAPSAGTSSHQSRPPPVVRSQEEIRAEVIGVFDSLPKTDELPEADPDPRVQTSLLKHQRQALWFMTARESEHLPDAGKAIVTSTWQKKTDRLGNPIYYNVVTQQTQPQQPPPTLGGILADMMGLGKTLSILSLVTKTLNDAERWSQQAPIQPKAPERKPQHPNHSHFEVPRPASFDLTPVRQNSRATLLVCPLSTITNWEDQIKQHIKPEGLKYHIYHGQNRIKDVAALAQHDLVITTYGSVISELNARVKGKRGLYPLEEIAWFRIVLDEAHTIREQNTLGFKSICRLQANRRWAVTGTPIQNKLEDLAALLAFLRLKPFDERSKFQQYIIQPFKAADPEIVPKLRVLIDTITLRRLKDRIHLPPCSDEVVRLDMSPEERQVYEWFARTAKDRVRAITSHDRIVGGKTMIHILRSILQLRLLCAHGKDLLGDEDLEELQGMTPDTAIDLDGEEDRRPVLREKKAYETLYIMQESNSDVCNRCNNKLGGIEMDDGESDAQDAILGYMARCFHTYCPACIGRVKNEGNECNECAYLDKAACVELRRRRAEMEHESRTARTKGATPGKIIPDERYSGPHTKTRALIQELLANKEKSAMCPNEPPFKSVVFSGWTSHLDLIQIALDNAGITYTRLDGKMSRAARNAAMDAFRDDPSVQVILVSIMAGGLGLNLTAGNSVYVMEPQFNPAAEAQAVDRVHRLGQTRAVRIVRFVMRDSFEEMMLKLQEKKKQLASLSMDRDPNDKIMDRTEAARQRLMDLRSLFK
ncbi:hypothetical protein VTJ83DRAFT_4812 [Remersonia thermophila]|uniref:Uncharacterized protein n=1 Tax=Remersonia thermophila TaxID=72144 RepID=A0ABR4DB06_9PEZI